MSPNPDQWKDDLYEAYVAKWEAQEAEESERRGRAGQVAIWLQRAPDDAETFTREQQAELHRIVDILRDKGLEPEAPFLTVDSVDAVSGYTGQIIIALALARIASPIVTAVLVTWLKGKAGRKIRIEFHPGGKLKRIEAQTEEQVLSIVKALAQETRPKAIKGDKE